MENSIIEQLAKINISENKIKELEQKPKIVENINSIREYSPEFTKMHYSLACTVPKDLDILKIADLIDRGLIRHENALKGVFKYYSTKSSEPIEEYIRRNDPSAGEIESRIKGKLPAQRGKLLRELKNEIPYCDFKVALEIINGLPADQLVEEERADPGAEEESADSKRNGKYKWLEEGLASRLHKPEENRQETDEILRKHLERTGSGVVTRFPPEPNGNLHIGHVKALNLSFEFAEKYGGHTYLRFDDTNPKKEKEEYFKSIKEDIEWLGFRPYKVTASSDYFEWMNERSYDLIRKNKAYVCHCSREDIKNRRSIFQNEREGGNFDPTILSPYRERSIEENLECFDRMMSGGYKDGEAVLRFKMDLSSRNPLMLDLVASRCIDIVHPTKQRNFHVYPSYEYALCVCDSLEDITHSFCSREFYTRQEPYHWVLKMLGAYEPVQWEFSKLILSNTVLSKRKMTQIVEHKGLSWDDPRLYTIRGMRRRGFTPDAINRFAKSAGITFSDSIMDVRALENYVRDDLFRVSKKVFCVRNPIKVTINELSKRSVVLPASASEGECNIEVSKVVYIDGSDFMEAPSEGYERLTKGNPVGLIGIGAIKFVEKTGDGIVCSLCDEKPKKFVQWVSKLDNKVVLRLYEPLFSEFDPDKPDFLNRINTEFETTEGYCDFRIKEAKTYDKFQFIRIGYFCCDQDSTKDSLVFNLTIPLRSSY